MFFCLFKLPQFLEVMRGKLIPLWLMTFQTIWGWTFACQLYILMPFLNVFDATLLSLIYLRSDYTGAGFYFSQTHDFHKKSFLCLNICCLNFICVVYILFLDIIHFESESWLIQQVLLLLKEQNKMYFFTYVCPWMFFLLDYVFRCSVRNINNQWSNKLWVSDAQGVGWCPSLVSYHSFWVIRSRARFLGGISG